MSLSQTFSQCGNLRNRTDADGYIRVAAVVPHVAVADVVSNTDSIISSLDKLEGDGVRIAVFPELCMTGYTCGDLFHQSLIQQKVLSELQRLKCATEGRGIMTVVGAPISIGRSLYNCGVVLADGKIAGIVPKTYLPNYNEFYEKRWFVSGRDMHATTVELEGEVIPAGTDLIFEVDGVGVGIELCEDLWTPIPPSGQSALNGAEIILNLSASDDLIGKYDYLKSLISQQSARCICGYVYASAGYGESSMDLVFDGKAIIYENGVLLAESNRWERRETASIADIDIEAIRRDRMHIMSFNDASANHTKADIRRIVIQLANTSMQNDIRRKIDPHPFVPSSTEIRDKRCEEIINIQISGLMQRLEITHTRSLTIGISGGLDSTLALLVAVRAFDCLGLDRKGIIGITMPGFGTTDRTHDNAIQLMETLGISIREIPISKAVVQHFADIEHDINIHDVTYENSQARERTQILMDVANQTGGMVLGTGDLSELALGWATYNGDHMSMYGVNAGIPKTLVRYLVTWCAYTTNNPTEKKILLDIIDTPISPELIPADENGEIKQKTEDLVGPYELHDFFLYYTLRYGFSPTRIYLMAKKAFHDSYPAETIRHWIRIFYRRFFNQQFKRSCLPDGPKIGSICLSPRGDWRMPSDATSRLWLEEIDKLSE